MTKLINLIDQRFGKLLVIERTDDYISPNLEHYPQWLCECDCGNVVTILGKSLRDKKTISCGCYRKEITTKRNFIDLSESIFGRLTVIKQVEDYVSPMGFHSYRWLCECSCGNNILVRTGELISGHTSSCGCLKKEQSSKMFLENLINKRFGMLTVIKRTNDYIQPNGTHATQWLCLCDCGNETVATAGSLKKGTTKSCGCLSESFISSELKKYFSINYASISEYRIFRNPETSYFLPYDIYIPENNIFIEINGTQHYELCNWHKTMSKRNGTTPQQEFQYQKKKDKLKKSYAKKHGTYIEIDLRKIKTTEDAIAYIENII